MHTHLYSEGRTPVDCRGTATEVSTRRIDARELTYFRQHPRMVSSLDCCKGETSIVCQDRTTAYVLLHFVAKLNGVENGALAGHRLHSTFLAGEALFDHLDGLNRLSTNHVRVLVGIIVGECGHREFVELADD